MIPSVILLAYSFTVIYKKLSHREHIARQWQRSSAAELYEKLQ